MDRDTRLMLYGTDEPVAAPRRLVAGPLVVAVADGAVRSLSWHGVELLRGIDYPVRNPDWGTFLASTVSEHIEELGDRFTYIRHFLVGDGLFNGRFDLEGDAGGAVRLSLRLIATRQARVNRAGFVVLHPVAGFAGAPLEIVHGEGTRETTAFPEFISPSQPIFDIASMLQTANGVTAEIVFSGEVFEMEDQRNWSDASYKTYCRPLSRPYPYDVPAGTVIEQSITITLSGADLARSVTAGQSLQLGAALGRPLPELALALEAGWQSTDPALAALQPRSTVLRLDLGDPDWTASLPALLTAVHGQLDLELIVSNDATAIAEELAELRVVLDRSGLAPRSVTPLPRAYLQSYQPQAVWPSGATPEAAVAAARHVFGDAAIGGGMLSNFTELNRYPAAARVGDFVTHGTTAIVHAADDASVLQTLEALPQIFASAEALAPGKPYCLGLVAIGMRSNPYGTAVASNPDGRRIPMAMLDPRQAGLFAAAFLVGAVAATEASRVDRLAPAAPAGPFGLVAGGSFRPIWHVFAALTRLGNAERLRVTAPAGMAAIAVASAGGRAVVVANLGPERRRLDLGQPGRAVLLDNGRPDPDWLALAPRRDVTSLELPAFAVAFVSFGPFDYFGAQP